VIYHLSKMEKVAVTDCTSKTKNIPGLTIDQDTSSAVFKRTGEIKRLDVFFKL